MRKKCHGIFGWARPSLVALSVLISGCQGTPSYQGAQRDILATYRVRKLTAELPATVRVPAAIAAAKTSLLDRGYTIKSASTTEDAGQIEAAPADAGLFESISIDIRQSSGGTKVQIIAEPMGHQTRSRAILDGMLNQLGL